MADFSFGVSMRLMRKTAPFILFRMAVYFGIAAAYVIVTGTGAGIGWGVGAMGDEDFQASATLWGGGLGFALTAGVIYFLREYILYMVKAGHIAVMVELLEGRDLPDGKGQIAYAQAMVKERFGQSSILFAVDQLVKGVVRAITGLIQGIASFLPIPGLDKIMSIVRAFLRVAVGLIDEVILAQIFRTRSENPWETARDAVVLYGQNAKPMMINAAWITVISYALAFVVFLLMLAPAGAIVYMMPGAVSAGGFIFAILFAWAAKVALIEPFAIACLLQAFFKVTEGQEPKPEWTAKLDGASAKFGKLAEKAAGWVGGKKAPEPVANTSTS
jgi:hypothetical protein